MTRIEAMNPPNPSPSPDRCEQVYLIERDAGLLCRILGLYAARALDVLHVDYAYAAQQVMRLSVRLNVQQGDGRADADELADTVRVLVDKIASLVGVIAAADLA